MLLQLSIRLVTFGTPASLRMLETMLLKINSRNSNPKLIDLISGATHNEALVVEEVLGFTARKVVSNSPKCNQIFSMDGTRSGIQIIKGTTNILCARCVTISLIRAVGRFIRFGMFRRNWRMCWWDRNNFCEPLVFRAVFSLQNKILLSRAHTLIIRTCV